MKEKDDVSKSTPTKEFIERMTDNAFDIVVHSTQKGRDKEAAKKKK